MFNFDIDWANVIKVLVPPVYRQEKHLDWLQAIFKPFISLYVSFKSYQEDTMYFTSITFQKIAMEKMLNDLYDAIHRRIYIEDVVKTDYVYIANKGRGYDEVYICNKWNSATSHNVGDVIRYADHYYECILASTGDQPDISPTYWAEDGDAVFIANKDVYGAEYDFIVYVPAMIYGVTNINEMRAYIEDYKFAAKRYTITTF